jgi:hypothetical protein
MTNWKAVVGYESYYEVSDKGQVMSLRAGRLLSPGTSGEGYVAVDLSVNGKRSRVRVHKIVLEAFVGPCPVGMECCHADDDRANNELSNLRWDTKKNNMKDRDAAGHTRKGDQHHAVIIDEQKAREIKAMIAAGKMPTEIAKALGVGRNVVANIKYNKTWSHV